MPGSVRDTVIALTRPYAWKSSEGSHKQQQQQKPDYFKRTRLKFYPQTQSHP